jgi:hypothetical protein
VKRTASDSRLLAMATIHEGGPDRKITESLRAVHLTFEG